MDECNSPGFFWGYGDYNVKNHLAYLAWNFNVKRTHTRKLLVAPETEVKKDASNKIAYAESLIEKQSLEILNMLGARN